MPASAPPDAPAMPHLVPPNRRVPRIVQRKSAATDNSQATARHDRGQDAAADPNRRICVSERLSGSRMPRRVCRTAREWQLLQGDDENDR